MTDNTVPPTTVTAVDRDSAGFVTISRSCGHPTWFAGTVDVKVGQPSMCLTCTVTEMLRHERRESDR